MIHPVIAYVIASVLFGLGVYGVLVRRNAVLLLMAVELMLNAVNLVLVTADATIRPVLPASGQVFTLFVIVLAAAEIGVGLAILLQLYRLRLSVILDELPLTEPAAATPEAATAPPDAAAAPPAAAASAAAPPGEPR